ncbi:hypothetical protein UT300001_23100 [Clostridium sp. CTA-1]
MLKSAGSILVFSLIYLKYLSFTTLFIVSNTIFPPFETSQPIMIISGSKEVIILATHIPR